MALNLQHQTVEQFAARFWKRLSTAFMDEDQLTYHRMIWWLWAKIQAGDLTSDQVRLSYNAYFNKALTTPQWNALVTSRFIPIKDRYLALKAETEV